MFCKKYPLFLPRIGDILHKIEEEKSITLRWTTGDQLYKAAKYTVVYNKLKRHLFQLRKEVVERFFLLSLNPSIQVSFNRMAYFISWVETLFNAMH